MTQSYLLLIVEFLLPSINLACQVLTVHIKFVDQTLSWDNMREETMNSFSMNHPIISSKKAVKMS